MDPILLNQNFENSGLIEKYTSLQWIRRYYDVGNFELHVSPEYFDQVMWQHHGDIPGFVGRCDGVSTAVDLNDCYKDYPQIIKDHLLNNWTRTDLDAAIKPETEKNPVTTISFLDAAKLLKQAGYTSITL